MFFPEELWRQYLSEKPPIPNLMPRYIVSTAGAVTVTAVFDIPKEYDAICTNGVIRTIAGAAQTTTSLSFRIRHKDQSNVQIAYLTNRTTQLDGMNWSGQIYLTSECQLQGVGGFSAGVAANEVNMSIFLILIPKSYILS